MNGGVPMRSPRALPWWLVALHGDFSSTLHRIATRSGAPSIAVSTIPTGRRIYFLVEPSLVSEATIARSQDFRDRQDASCGREGVVGAVGTAWARRREKLRYMQTSAFLERVAAPAVADALGRHCPSYALMLTPSDLLPIMSRVVRHALHAMVLSAQPPEAAHEAQARRSLRQGVVGNLVRYVARALAACALLKDQLWALMRTSSSEGFFYLAYIFTSRSRKVERRARQYASRVATRPQQSSTARAAVGAATSSSPDWIESKVQRRWAAARRERSHEPPRDLLDALMAGDGPERSAVDTNARDDGFDGGANADASSAARDGRRALASARVESTTSPSASESQGKAARLGRDEVLAVVRDVLTAGLETTTETLLAAVMLVRENPSVAERVAEEARELMHSDSGGTPLDGSSISAAAKPSGLPYTRACVLEAARLHPAASLIMRVALRDSSLGGVEIPAGSGVVASTEALGRDPAVWGDRADEFVPERFIAHDGSATGRARTVSKAAYYPFGAGQRSCVGQQAALTIATLALAYIVANDVEDAHDDALQVTASAESESTAWSTGANNPTA